MSFLTAESSSLSSTPASSGESRAERSRQRLACGGPDGSFSFEVNGYFFTKGGESVSFKGQGVGWPTGAGWKASIRGAAQYWTSSQKLAPANKTIGAFEVEVNEDGTDHVKAWAWK